MWQGSDNGSIQDQRSCECPESAQRSCDCPEPWCGARLRDKPSFECEWKIPKVLRPLAQYPLTHRQAQVAEGLLGLHPSAVYCLSSRFLKDPNGYSHDL
jgi:hypothetical protein